jgi:hypothetical protein
MKLWLRRLLPWIAAPVVVAVWMGAAALLWWALAILGAVGVALALKVYEEGWTARRIVARKVHRLGTTPVGTTSWTAYEAERYVESIPWWRWLGAEQEVAS